MCPYFTYKTSNIKTQTYLEVHLWSPTVTAAAPAAAAAVQLVSQLAANWLQVHEVAEARPGNKENMIVSIDRQTSIKRKIVFKNDQSTNNYLKHSPVSYCLQ